jgi:hypothetical protein
MKQLFDAALGDQVSMHRLPLRGAVDSVAYTRFIFSIVVVTQEQNIPSMTLQRFDRSVDSGSMSG